MRTRSQQDYNEPVEERVHKSYVEITDMLCSLVSIGHIAPKPFNKYCVDRPTPQSNCLSLIYFLNRLQDNKTLAVLSMQNLLPMNISQKDFHLFVLKLVEILPTTNILALNIGEYEFKNIHLHWLKMCLKESLVGFIYLTEHYLTAEDIEHFKNIARENREKIQAKLQLKNPVVAACLRSYRGCWWNASSNYLLRSIAFVETLQDENQDSTDNI